MKLVFALNGLGVILRVWNNPESLALLPLRLATSGADGEDVKFNRLTREGDNISGRRKLRFISDLPRTSV